jgi:hypothetical protein
MKGFSIKISSHVSYIFPSLLVLLASKEIIISGLNAFTSKSGLIICVSQKLSSPGGTGQSLIATTFFHIFFKIPANAQRLPQASPSIRIWFIKRIF